MTARLHEIFKNEIRGKIFKENKLSSVMAVPFLEKVVVSMGIGKICSDSGKAASAKKMLSLLAGQLPVSKLARKSVAAFKLREGMPVGLMVTLRKGRMYDFVDRLVHMALPSQRGFKGFNIKSISDGCFSCGIDDVIVFPEVRELMRSSESLGVNITFVTSSKRNDLVVQLLRSLGLPFIGDKK